MTKLTSVAIFFLAAGYLTSVTILSAYQVLFVIPLTYYTWLAFKNKDFNLPKSSYWLMAFIVVALISLLLNLEYVPKPSKNFGKIKYFLYGIAGIWALRPWIKEASDKQKKVVFNTFLVSIIVVAFYALYTFFFKGNARAEVLTEKMRYGYGSGMILLVLLGTLLHKKQFDSYYTFPLAVAAFIMGFIGMYITYTRGALLGFLCGLPLVIFFYRKKLGLLLGGAAVVVVAIWVSIYLFGSGNYNSRLLVSKNNSSDGIRKSQWKAAVIAIQEKPLLGWGHSNFSSQVKRIKIENNLEWQDYEAHAHNLFLDIAAGTGLIGLFIFIGWILTWAWECYQADGYVRKLVIPFGVAFVVCSQFEVTFDANNATMIFFIYAMSSLRFRGND